MACRNICERYRATKDKASSYYAQRFKRCQMCELFIKWGGAVPMLQERAEDKAPRQE